MKVFLRLYTDRLTWAFTKIYLTVAIMTVLLLLYHTIQFFRPRPVDEPSRIERNDKMEYDFLKGELKARLEDERGMGSTRWQSGGSSAQHTRREVISSWTESDSSVEVFKGGRYALNPVPKDMGRNGTGRRVEDDSVLHFSESE